MACCCVSIPMTVNIYIDAQYNCLCVWLQVLYKSEDKCVSLFLYALMKIWCKMDIDIVVKMVLYVSLNTFTNWRNIINVVHCHPEMSPQSNIVVQGSRLRPSLLPEGWYFGVPPPTKGELFILPLHKFLPQICTPNHKKQWAVKRSILILCVSIIKAFIFTAGLLWIKGQLQSAQVLG